jgi:hypothetical protein
VRCLCTQLLQFLIHQLMHFSHCDEVQVFLGIFQQITPALNQCIYCLLKRCIKKKTRSSIERTIVSKN